MVEAIDAPAQDHFQIVTEHSATEFIFDPAYLGVSRSDDIVIIQITFSFGRKPPQKRKLYRRIVEILAIEPGIRPQDVLINLVETAWENWSFGNGEAQYTN
jgi:hypothetical protein